MEIGECASDAILVIERTIGVGATGESPSLLYDGSDRHPCRSISFRAGRDAVACRTRARLASRPYRVGPPDQLI